VVGTHRPEPGEVGHVTVHREDRVGDDHRAPGVGQQSAEVVEVPVAVDRHPGPAESAAVDDRGVVELVGEHGDARAAHHRQDAEVGGEPRREEDRPVLGLPGGQLDLQVAVDGATTDDQAGRAAPRPAAVEGLVGGGDHRRVLGQTEVVVGGERGDRPTVQGEPRPTTIEVPHCPPLPSLPNALPLPSRPSRPAHAKVTPQKEAEAAFRARTSLSCAAAGRPPPPPPPPPPQPPPPPGELTGSSPRGRTRGASPRSGRSRPR